MIGSAPESGLPGVPPILPEVPVHHRGSFSSLDEHEADRPDVLGKMMVPDRSPAPVSHHEQRVPDDLSAVVMGDVDPEAPVSRRNLCPGLVVRGAVVFMNMNVSARTNAREIPTAVQTPRVTLRGFLFFLTVRLTALFPVLPAALFRGRLPPWAFPDCPFMLWPLFAWGIFMGIRITMTATATQN